MRKTFWEIRFNALATYNSEVSRGLIHTKEYADEMRKLQVEYDAKLVGTSEIGL